MKNTNYCGLFIFFYVFWIFIDGKKLLLLYLLTTYKVYLHTHFSHPFLLKGCKIRLGSYAPFIQSPKVKDKAFTGKDQIYKG